MRFLLFPFSLIYGLGFCVFKMVVRSKDLGIYTISVGNIRVGGTGKTPVVEALAKYLISRGKKPMILIRGYRSGIKAGDYAVLLNGNLQSYSASKEPRNFGDEAMQHSCHLPEVPICIGPNRFENGVNFLRNVGLRDRPDVAILDDGFQHLSLRRNVDIAVLDEESATRRIGVLDLLPGGRYRETSSSLIRADCILVPHQYFKPNNKIAGASSSSVVAPMSTIVCEPRLMVKSGKSPAPYSLGKGSELCLVVGIARPERFIQASQELGFVIKEIYVVADHQAFDRDRIVELKKHSLPLLITTKDYYRDPRVFEGLGLDVWVLAIEAKVDFSSILKV